LKISQFFLSKNFRTVLHEFLDEAGLISNRFYSNAFNALNTHIAKH